MTAETEKKGREVLQGEHPVLGRDIDLVGTFLPKPSYLLSFTYDYLGAIVNGKG